ncbi:MAG: SRPBCC family protein [Flavobacteriaceae bacterium]|tara:strand:- start:317 stop:724 length:408 start_codon:yes stop_codon:yes gene_type:complete
MNLESPKISLSKSANEVFDFLSNVKNFEGLMPENISKFDLLEKDKFIFALTGMPEIILQKKSEVAPNRIVLGAAGGKLDFTLKAKITSIEANKTEVQLSFTGNFNPMMAMMIKGPISKFIETLVTNIPKSIQYSI